MEVPFPRAASRRLINFLIFQISICFRPCQILLLYDSAILDADAGQRRQR